MMYWIENNICHIYCNTCIRKLQYLSYFEQLLQEISVHRVSLHLMLELLFLLSQFGQLLLQPLYLRLFLKHPLSLLLCFLDCSISFFILEADWGPYFFVPPITFIACNVISCHTLWYMSKLKCRSCISFIFLCNSSSRCCKLSNTYINPHNRVKKKNYAKICMRLLLQEDKHVAVLGCNESTV